LETGEGLLKVRRDFSLLPLFVLVLILYSRERREKGDCEGDSLPPAIPLAPFLSAGRDGVGEGGRRGNRRVYYIG
jgi:hypothetical protein